MWKTFLTILFLLSAVALAAPDNPPTASLPESGAISWRDWSFSYSIGSANSEGLVLRNVRYKDRLFIFKASMPVIRVKYKSPSCGPYTDTIGYFAIQTLPGAKTKVVAQEYIDILEVGIYATIGGYKLYQSWFFTPTKLEPRLYSSGWSCNDRMKSNNDHRHHPYWRIDFDINGIANTAWIHSKNPAFFGRFVQLEENLTSNNRLLLWSSSNPSIFVKIEYPNNELADGTSPPWSGFSQIYAGFRRYKYSEDNGWTEPAAKELPYLYPEPESVYEKDLIFWSAGHLSHSWTLQDTLNNAWHFTGPRIYPVVGD